MNRVGGKVYGPEKSQLKAAGLFINSSLNYITAPSDKPGQGGFPFAFWQLLHYITVQSIDRDARFGFESILSTIDSLKKSKIILQQTGHNDNCDKLVTKSNVQRLLVPVITLI